MLDLPTEFSPDLDWMLQSGEATPDILLEALVEEFYPGVFRLALAILDDLKAARRATNETFSRSLVEVYKYRTEVGVRIWLYQIVLEVTRNALGRLQARRTFLAWFSFLSKSSDFGESIPQTELDAEIWLAFDQLDPATRQIAVLHYIFEWDIDLISKLTNQSMAEIQLSLDKIWEKLILASSIIERLAVQDQEINQTQIDDLFKQSLQKRWPLTNPTELEIGQTLGLTTRRARSIGNRRRWIVSLIEISVIAFIILLGAGIAWGMNVIDGNKPPTATPSPQYNEVIETKIVFHYVTATPKVLETSATATPSTSTRPDQFIYAHNKDTIEDLAKKLNVSQLALKTLNRLPKNARLQSGQRLLIPGPWEYLSIAQATAVPAIEPAPTLEEPFLSESVLQRFAVQGLKANTFWIDGFVIDYGPSSYIGPEDIYHVQIWDSKEQSLSLIGLLDQLPNEVVLRDSLKGYLLLAKPRSDLLWFSEWQELGNQRSKSLQIMQKASQILFDTREFERGYTFIDMGRENLAGINSLIIDAYNRDGKRTDRIWYDDRRGFILRRISFLPDNEAAPSFEVQVRSVQYDIDIPQTVLNPQIPWRGGYAQDAGGVPAATADIQPQNYDSRQRLPLRAPPPDFDAANGTITFQYPLSYKIGSFSSQVQLFSDGYMLGDISFGDPWQSICDRSPDGQWIAYVSNPVHSTDVNTQLHWSMVANPIGDDFQTLLRFGVSEFAFSPGSKEIAFFSNPSSNGLGELGIVSITTHQEQSLFKLGDAKSLVWSPDGKNLGMIARLNPDSYLENIVVFNLEKNAVIYNSPIDFVSNAEGDWPMVDWGVEFPVDMGDIDTCSIRPTAE
jgi:DNA-directed RNA polymerase specialized sigma24 family protein